VTFNGQTGFVSGAYLKEVTTDPGINRDTYQFVDLRTQSSVTAKQINDYIAAYVNLKGKKSVLTGQGQLFIDAGKQYGVNALYLAAHAIHESGYGTSAI
ncbi:peptide-binding protein, partial [Pseudomonas sp. FW305-BF6]|uniref:glucosaminidase domain-containing protein n=1 Tax=Pseudomonas sp. FW305-BF6 TaxID=2070673 RepID=UPI000CC9734A